MSSIQIHNEHVLKGSNLTFRSSVLPGWDIGSCSVMMTSWMLFSPRFDS